MKEVSYVQYIRPAYYDPWVCIFAIGCPDLISKVNQMRTAIMSMCSGTTPPPIQQSNHPVTWTSVTKRYIGSSNLQHASTMTFTIPNIIPSSAREVLIYVGVKIGQSNNGPNHDLKVFTQIGTNKYEKYLMSHSWHQLAINTNSENMWFPMPPNRRVYLTVPTAYGRRAAAYLYAIGYR